MAASDTFKVTIEIDQGATYDKTWTWKAGSTPTAVDLTGATARAQFRDAVGKPLLLELSTVNGRIILGGAAGTIRFLITATDTALITAWTEAVFDLDITFANGVVRRLMEGRVKVNLGVTV